MLPFVGEFRHSIDNKGRLIIPSKFRSNFGDRIYLCKGFENCLLILMIDEIEKIQDKIKSESLISKDVRKLSRAFFSGMVDVGFDSQGRILIPNNLREYAKIGSEAIIVGTGFYVEIWDNEAWNNDVCNLNEERSRLADFLGERQ